MTIHLAKLMRDEIKGDITMVRDILKRLEATEETLNNLITKEKKNENISNCNDP